MANTKRKRRPVPALRPQLAGPVHALLERGAQPEELMELLSRNGYDEREARRLANDLDRRYQDHLRGETPELSTDALIERQAAIKPRGFAVFACLALMLGGYYYLNHRVPDDLGKPCRSESDCESSLCMLEVDEGRHVTSGYCSKPCNDVSDCGTELWCKAAVEGSGMPGQAWDGMIGKKLRACAKP